MFNIVIVCVAVLVFFGFDHYAAFGLVCGTLGCIGYKEVTE